MTANVQIFTKPIFEDYWNHIQSVVPCSMAWSCMLMLYTLQTEI